VLTRFFQVLTVQLCPTTYDALVYAADDRLGVQWSFVVGQLFEAVPPLMHLCLGIYNTLPLAFLVVLVMQRRDRQPPYLDAFPALVATGFAGFCLYLLFPVVGPLAAFAEVFPHSPPAASDVLSHPLPWFPDMRNCMPSLHTSWVLLVWWHARPLARWVRIFAGIYLVCTLLATLGLGMHYAFDLVVAVPFVTAVQALCAPVSASPAKRRWGPVPWWGSRDHDLVYRASLGRIAGALFPTDLAGRGPHGCWIHLAGRSALSGSACVVPPVATANADPESRAVHPRTANRRADPDSSWGVQAQRLIFSGGLGCTTRRRNAKWPSR
jgi:hypothetical protein